jgi:glycosyltransferase involved in cell wall biosynthesis
MLIKKKLKTIISVVIPVYNNNPGLSNCLTALENQSLDHQLFEVIVVDNGSLVKPNYNATKINLKIIDCKIPGSYSARNSGILISSGDYIAFTDSDCIPDIDWLKNIFKYLDRNENIDIISGDIHYIFKSKKPNYFECYDIVFGFGQKALFEKGASVTANLAIRKELFKKVGYFETDKFSGGDTQWVRKAVANNYKFIFDHEIVVKHPARYTFAQLLNREKRIYGGSFKIREFNKMNYLYKIMASLYPLRPPINAVLKILKEKKLGLADKFVVSFLLISLRMLSWIEHIKLIHNFKETR